MHRRYLLGRPSALRIAAALALAAALFVATSGAARLSITDAWLDYSYERGKFRAPSSELFFDWTLPSIPAAQLPASVKCELDCPEAMDCGSPAVCAVRNDSPQCVCPDSQVYIASEKQCRSCKQDCGTAARCTMKDGAAQCVCPEKLIFNATTRMCDAPDPCVGVKCADFNAQCVRKGEEGVCECKAGFYDDNGECMDLCGKIDCPANKECVPKGEKRVCQCWEGYTESNGECISPNPCDVTVTQCQVNEECRERDGKGVCECVKGFTRRGGECSAPVDPCSVMECPPGSACKGGVCEWGGMNDPGVNDPGMNDQGVNDPGVNDP
ncbi:unnamed protein product, partial [Closterium sp. NIES-54]